jgi:exodeoxyribonuclease V alpha subunit
VHKSQGSEYPVVILPLFACAPPLLTRNLIYTAVTRAREMVILVGRREIAARMVENNRHDMRYTCLCYRIGQAEREYDHEI